MQNQKTIIGGSDSTVCSCAAPLTFGSLFAGIGGIDLGFERVIQELPNGSAEESLKRQNV